jgi:subtilisin family serine protease
MAALATLAACSGSSAPVDAEVQAAVEAKGSAPVIVLLREPIAAAATEEVSARRATVARSQQALLGDLSPSDLAISHRYEVVSAVAGEVSKAGLERLKAHPEVASVHLDREVTQLLRQSRPLVQADKATTQLAVTGKGINVAVIDSGIDADHPDLSSSLIRQKCFCRGCCANNLNTGDTAPDGSGHGTHVAGIISGDGKVAPIGIAPEAGIIAIKVLNDNGNGSESNVIGALDWVSANAAALKIRLVNMSIGFPGFYAGDCNAVAHAGAARQAIARGVALFAASANSGVSTGIQAPSCIGGVISVGAVYDANVGAMSWQPCRDATTAADQIVCFSNSAPNLDILAPGSSVVAAYPNDRSAALSGTSMASPAATAVAALVLQRRPDLTPVSLERVLESSGKPITDPRNGLVRPRVDALAALKLSDPARCFAKVDGASCDDGNACTRKDVCQAGQCVGTNPVTCAGESECRDGASCDPKTGACIGGTVKPEGSDCAFPSEVAGAVVAGFCEAGECAAKPVPVEPEPKPHVPTPEPSDDVPPEHLSSGLLGSGCATAMESGWASLLLSALLRRRRRSS